MLTYSARCNLFGSWGYEMVQGEILGEIPIPTLYQEDLHLDTCMRDQLYLRLKSLFTVTKYQDSYTLYTLYLCGYPTITLLLYMTTTPSSRDLLCYSMTREEGSTPIYRTPWLIWFYHVLIFYTLSTKYPTLKFFSCYLTIQISSF